MKVLDLFSGIGGFSLGLERAGMTTVAFCEIDEYCQKVLKKHWPTIPIFKDIRNLKGEEIGPVDLICGGFPCQPFSVAGKRDGTSDDRHLWPEMLRLISETKPTWIIGENVAGITSMELELGPFEVESRTLTTGAESDYLLSVLSRQEIMLLDAICRDLECEGYEVQPVIIPACAVDAKHRRDRVWIIAHNEKWSDGAYYNTEQIERQKQKFGKSIGRENVAYSQDSKWHDKPHKESRQHKGWEPAGGCFGIVWRNWPIEPSMDRVVNGLPEELDPYRIKALGNAVVRQIPEIIGRAIMEIEHDKSN